MRREKIGSLKVFYKLLMETPYQIVYRNGGEGMPWKSLEKAL